MTEKEKGHRDDTGGDDEFIFAGDPRFDEVDERMATILNTPDEDDENGEDVSDEEE